MAVPCPEGYGLFASQPRPSDGQSDHGHEHVHVHEHVHGHDHGLTPEA